MATTADVASGLIALVKQVKLAEAVHTYYSPDIVSTEEMGETHTVTGLDAIKGKMDYFQGAYEIHGIECSEPLSCLDQFVVEYKMDTTNRQNGERTQMHEYALYTVKDGKISAEKYFYNMG
jgi:hypothetical protein